MLNDLLQGWVLLTGLLGIYLIKDPGSKRRERWGFLVGVLGQPAWLWLTWSAGQWGLFALALFYLYAWGHGAWQRWSVA